MAANYRAACRGRSKAEFISKLAIVEEEADEAMFWLELIKEMNILKESMVDALLKESNEIIAIIVSSIKTVKRKNPKSKIQNPISTLLLLRFYGAGWFRLLMRRMLPLPVRRFQAFYGTPMTIPACLPTAEVKSWFRAHFAHPVRPVPWPWGLKG